MGKVKINANVFLGSAELNREQKMKDDWGIKRHALINSQEFGLVRDLSLPETGQINRQDCLLVQRAGTPIDEVVVSKGILVDSLGRLAVSVDAFNMVIPNDGNVYWIRAEYAITHKEIGTVSIDTFGNLSGIGTEFTSIFRGQPEFPTKIRFLNSISGNGDEYEVVRVIDDTTAIIQGDFIAEVGLQFSVFGTFTPGYPPTINEQDIFEYDSISLTLVQEVFVNTRPPYNPSEQFYLARTSFNGVTISLEDKRTEWWKSQGENLSTFLPRLSAANPMIGVENVKFDNPNSPRDKNQVDLAWGFRFAGYTIDSASNKISILIGNGGKFKDTSFFSNGDFNEWRLYSKNGDYQTVIDSVASGTQIILTLDVLDVDDYGLTDDLLICPPFEEIEIRFQRDGAVLDVDDVDGDADTAETLTFPTIEQKFSFNINTPIGSCKVQTVDNFYLYNVMYRYKTFLGYTDWLIMPDDPVGYYDESSFDKYGNLKPNPIDRTSVPYVGDLSLGFIKVTEAPDSFQNFQDLVQTGDLFGVRTTALSNSLPLLELEVGIDKQYQHFKGAITLTGDIFIHLKDTNALSEPFREGNNFILHFEQWIELPAPYRLRIVTNYVNPSTFDLVQEITLNETNFIKNQTSDELAQAERRGMMVRCTYNETAGPIRWIAHFQSDTLPKGAIIMGDSSIAANSFDGTGKGLRRGFWGWQICNGNNGTDTMVNFFPRGMAVSGAGVVTGGADTVTIGNTNLPEHSHTINDPGHGHQVNSGVPDGDGTNNYLTRGANTEDNNYIPTSNPSAVTTGITIDDGGGVPIGDVVALNNIPAYKGVLFLQKMV